MNLVFILIILPIICFFFHINVVIQGEWIISLSDLEFLDTQ